MLRCRVRRACISVTIVSAKLPCCVALNFFDARIDHTTATHVVANGKRDVPEAHNDVRTRDEGGEGGETQQQREEQRGEEDEGSVVVVEDETEAVWMSPKRSDALASSPGMGRSMSSPLLGADRGDIEALDIPAKPSSIRRLVDRVLCERNVPFLLFLSDLVTSLASGMTIKFFPLWLKDEVGLSPSMSLVTESLTYVMMALFSPVALAVSKRLKRLPTMIGTRVMGTSILIGLGLLKPFWRHWEVILPLYLLRMGIMNCTGALNTSIMVRGGDQKPREWTLLLERARTLFFV